MAESCEDDDHVAANEDPRRGKARNVLSALAGEMTCTAAPRGASASAQRW